MEAVRIEKVAARCAASAFLTGCAGIRNRAVVSPQEGLVEVGAEQSRDKSWSRARMPQSQVQPSSGHFCGKLNRQTPEVETTLSPRKQRIAKFEPVFGSELTHFYSRSLGIRNSATC
jgi:hypothetical protein